MIGSAVGPAPFPALVRDLQRVIGDEAREQALAAEGALPARVIACVGGGSNSIGIFTPFVADAEVELIGVEAAGRGARHAAATAPRSGAGGTGVLHGSLSSVIADEEGQILEAHSISAGLDYPGRRPRARPPARHRPGQLRRGHRRRRRWPPSPSSRRLEGIIPALESSHAIAWLLENGGGERLRRALPLRARRQGPGRGRWPS